MHKIPASQPRAKGTGSRETGQTADEQNRWDSLSPVPRGIGDKLSCNSLSLSCRWSSYNFYGWNAVSSPWAQPLNGEVCPTGTSEVRVAAAAP